MGLRTSSVAAANRRSLLLCLPVLAGLAASLPAQAQTGGCILDHCRDRMPASGAPSPGAPGNPGGVAPAAFDFYVLALSWSPGFCATHRSERDGAQCASGSQSGFVVHGLWPQFDRGFPQNCGDGGPVPRFVLDQTRGLYPDPGLARYEWRKHGTCTGLSPSAYFAAVRRARALVQVPPVFEAGQRQPQQMSPNDIQRAIMDANPRLRPGMMAVGCARGQLQEVRVCLSKNLRDFQPCGEVARDSCRAGRIEVEPIQ